jgi:hypothetical protein
MRLHYGMPQSRNPTNGSQIRDHYSTNSGRQFMGTFFISKAMLKAGMVILKCSWHVAIDPTAGNVQIADMGPKYQKVSANTWKFAHG